MSDALQPPVDDAPPHGELLSMPPGRGGGAGRVPPHNLQAEESLLGAMMLSRDAIATAVQAVGAADFYKPGHAHVFEAISALYASGEPVDAISVAEQLRRADLFDAVGGAATLAHLQASTPATSNAGHYAKIVEEHSLMRKLIGVAGEIADIGYSQPDDVERAVDDAETMVFQVAERKVSDTLSSIHDLMEDSLDRLESLYERGDSITGVATGYHDLDEVLSGLQKGQLVVLGARPAMGKCVAWDTPIVDPETGAVLTAAECHRRGTGGDPVDVLSLDEESQRLVRRTPSDFVDDGIKPVFEVRTRLGRSIRTTA
ncbi:MAG: DnaB-like helicase N-terminal domain-containing protein, partial [Actinomycetota bacterium]